MTSQASKKHIFQKLLKKRLGKMSNGQITVPNKITEIVLSTYFNDIIFFNLARGWLCNVEKVKLLLVKNKYPKWSKKPYYVCM